MDINQNYYSTTRTLSCGPSHSICLFAEADYFMDMTEEEGDEKLAEGDRSFKDLEGVDTADCYLGMLIVTEDLAVTVEFGGLGIANLK